jgi:hypothetical protein
VLAPVVVVRGVLVPVVQVVAVIAVQHDRMPAVHPVHMVVLDVRSAQVAGPCGGPPEQAGGTAGMCRRRQLAPIPFS